MAKQLYIDENGNPIEVSGTINTAELLPISGNDPTDTKTYIDMGLSGKQNTLTPTAITNLSFNGINVSNVTYSCHKYGRIVVLNITSIKAVRDIGSTENEICTGLPIPIDENNRLTIIDPDTWKPYRVRVTNDGRLIFWYNTANAPINTTFYGVLVYTSAT